MTPNCKPNSNQEKDLKPQSTISSFGGEQVAEKTVKQNSTCIQLPFIGQITVPPPEGLAWYAGVGLLGITGIVDWPIVAVMSLGRLLSEMRRNKTLQDFGQALEQVSIKLQA